MENQPETILVEFIRYNNWANHQVLQACQNLSEDQLDTAAPGAYGTIRLTLLHIIWAEADYVGRLTGTRPYPSFKRGDQPSVAGLSAFASDVAPPYSTPSSASRPTTLSMRRKTATPSTTKPAACSSRSSTTASSTAQTSPPSLAAWVSPLPKWMAGATWGRTRMSLR